MKRHGERTVKSFEKKILSTCNREGLLPRGASMLVACSGGPDSLALLYALARFARARDWRIGVFTLDHGLRPESMEELRFVDRTATDLGCPFYGESVPVGDIARETGESFETAGRRIRYERAGVIAVRDGYESIVTAHHRDDQAETVLAHLIRGSGTDGLAGMAYRNGNIVRPLLDVTKDDILAYCEALDLKFATDVTNFDTRYMRNRIRWQVLPEMKELNPDVSLALSRLARSVRYDREYLETEGMRAFKRTVMRIGRGRIEIDRQALAREPDALQARVWERVARTLHTDLRLQFSHKEQLMRMTSGGEEKAFETGRMKVFMKCDKIEVVLSR